MNSLHERDALVVELQGLDVEARCEQSVLKHVGDVTGRHIAGVVTAGPQHPALAACERLDHDVGVVPTVWSGRFREGEQ